MEGMSELEYSQSVVIESLRNTIVDLQKKYNAVIEDKQRWRNYALLGVAGGLMSYRGYRKEVAVAAARELLTMIEQHKESDDVRSGEQQPG